MNKDNLAVIVGGTGAIGNAIANELEKLGFKEVLKIGTKTNPSIDFNDENKPRTQKWAVKKNEQI